MKTGLAMVTLLAVIAFTGWASADDESASLEERVEALEARLAAMERGTDGSDLRVRSLTVVDAQGKPRVLLGVEPSNSGLVIQDELGRGRIRLGTDSHGNARLHLLERTSGRVRMSMALLHGDAPYIRLRSPNSSLRIEAPHDGAVGIGMLGGPGEQNERSHAGFWIWNDGTIAWGGGQRSAGHTGFHLKQTRDGLFDFVVRDREEALLWEMPQRSPPTAYAPRTILEALQSRDADEQRWGIEALTAALSGDDGRLALSALGLLRRVRDVEYDREAMEGLVRTHLDSPDGRARVAALWALLSVRGYSRGDLESALEVADTDDIQVLTGVAYPLLFHAQKRIEGGPVEAAFLRLLRHEKIEVALAAAQALTQAQTTDAVNEALIALWKQHRERYHEVVLALTKVKPRTLPVVKALLEEVGLPDVHGLHEREVLDALRDVETEETKAAVVAGGLHLLEVVKSEVVLKGLLRLIARYGSPEDADRLERILATTPLTDSVKRTGEAGLRELHQRHR